MHTGSCKMSFLWSIHLSLLRFFFWAHPLFDSNKLLWKFPTGLDFLTLALPKWSMDSIIIMAPNCPMCQTLGQAFIRTISNSNPCEVILLFPSSKYVRVSTSSSAMLSCASGQPWSTGFRGCSKPSTLTLSSSPLPPLFLLHLPPPHHINSFLCSLCNYFLPLLYILNIFFPTDSVLAIYTWYSYSHPILEVPS